LSINKYRPHLFVLPEDDANRQIANGFLLCPNLNERAIQILPPRGGWMKVLEFFTKEHVPEMIKYKERQVVLLIDFDMDCDRFHYATSKIPNDLKERVFIIGVKSVPEDLRKKLRKSFECIGKDLAQDCIDKTNDVWGHELLIHNNIELVRMITKIKPFLFNTIGNQ
jgi:hypothetical protein